MTASEAIREHGWQRSQKGRIYPTLTGSVGAAPSTPKTWPTASASDWKGSTKPGQRRRQLTEKIEPHSPGRLNPEWVEMLMGFPAGWTATDGQPHPDHTNTHTSHPAPDPDSPPTSSD